MIDRPKVRLEPYEVDLIKTIKAFCDDNYIPRTTYKRLRMAVIDMAVLHVDPSDRFIIWDAIGCNDLELLYSKEITQIYTWLGASLRSDLVKNQRRHIRAKEHLGELDISVHRNKRSRKCHSSLRQEIESRR